MPHPIKKLPGIKTICLPTLPGGGGGGGGGGRHNEGARVVTLLYSYILDPQRQLTL